MRLVTARRVPNGRRVEIFLAEKGLSLPVEHVDLVKLEHRTPEFARKNALLRVPVLELDDGEYLSESIAICRYFEALHPEPALFGRDAREQAMIEMWNRRVELDLYFAVQHAFRHTHPGMATLEQPQIGAWGEANRDKAIAFMRLLDRHLEERDFIWGDGLSVADITALVAIDFLKPAKLAVPEDCAALRRWHAAISARPSITSLAA